MIRLPPSLTTKRPTASLADALRADARVAARGPSPTPSRIRRFDAGDLSERRRHRGLVVCRRRSRARWRRRPWSTRPRCPSARSSRTRASTSIVAGAPVVDRRPRRHRDQVELDPLLLDHRPEPREIAVADRLARDREPLAAAARDGARSAGWSPPARGRRATAPSSPRSRPPPPRRAGPSARPAAMRERVAVLVASRRAATRRSRRAPSAPPSPSRRAARATTARAGRTPRSRARAGRRSVSAAKPDADEAMPAALGKRVAGADDEAAAACPGACAAATRWRTRALDELGVGRRRAPSSSTSQTSSAPLSPARKLDGAERATARERHRDRRRVGDRALEVARAPVLDERDVGRSFDAGLHIRLQAHALGAQPDRRAATPP